MEDCQPNEVRPARKGISNAPVVRPVIQRGNPFRRGGYIGRGGRGHGRGGQGGRGGHAYPPSRQQISDSHPGLPPQRQETSSSYNGPRTRIEHVCIELPEYCRKGAYRGTFYRQGWVSHEKRQLELSGHRVVRWEFKGTDVIFRIEKDDIFPLGGAHGFMAPPVNTEARSIIPAGVTMPINPVAESSRSASAAAEPTVTLASVKAEEVEAFMPGSGMEEFIPGFADEPMMNLTYLMAEAVEEETILRPFYSGLLEISPVPILHDGHDCHDEASSDSEVDLDFCWLLAVQNTHGERRTT